MDGDRGLQERICERCGGRGPRDLMCVVFPEADGRRGAGDELGGRSGCDPRILGSPALGARTLDARVEVWCDDCQAELEPFWAMLTGDPAEDCDTVEDLYARRLAPKAAIHEAWARLRDGTPPAPRFGS